MAQQPVVGQGILIIEASRLHSNTPHAVGLFWTSDQPNAETSLSLSDNALHWEKTDIHAPAGFEPAVPASE
jgi:hypothetical protein